MLPTRDLPPTPEGISGARVHRPRLAVVDDYVDVGVTPLDPATFDPNDTHVAKVVVDGFMLHHGVDEEVARAEVRAFARDAIAAGRHRQDVDGKHLLDWHGIRVRLSADGAAILSYRTFHYERLPSEVLAGTPSRFKPGRSGGRGKRAWRAPGDDEPDELTEAQMLALMRDGKARVAEKVLSLYARRAGFGKDLRSAEAPLRAELATAAKTVDQALPVSESGSPVLIHGGVGWIIAMPEGVVVATFPVGKARTAP